VFGVITVRNAASLNFKRGLLACVRACVIGRQMYLNILKPTCYVTHHQFNIQQLYFQLQQMYYLLVTSCFVDFDTYLNPCSCLSVRGHESLTACKTTKQSLSLLSAAAECHWRHIVAVKAANIFRTLSVRNYLMLVADRINRDRSNFLISNLMHKILVYLHIIHLLKSSTCFEH
jgi:hypothetical protein